MPQILDRLIGQLTTKGMSKDKAYNTAVKVLTKSGNLDKDRNLTNKGKKRQASSIDKVYSRGPQLL